MIFGCVGRHFLLQGGVDLFCDIEVNKGQACGEEEDVLRSPEAPENAAQEGYGNGNHMIEALAHGKSRGDICVLDGDFSEIDSADHAHLGAHAVGDKDGVGQEDANALGGEPALDKADAKDSIDDVDQDIGPGVDIEEALDAKAVNPAA